MCSFIAHHMQLVATDMCRLLNDCNCKKMLACGLLLWETHAFMKDKIVGNFLQKSLSLFFFFFRPDTCHLHNPHIRIQVLQLVSQTVSVSH